LTDYFVLVILAVFFNLGHSKHFMTDWKFWVSTRINQNVQWWYIP